MALDLQKARNRLRKWKKLNPERLKEINRISHKKMWENPEYRERKKRQAIDRVKKQKEIVYSNYGMVCNCCGMNCNFGKARNKGMCPHKQNI